MENHLLIVRYAYPVPVVYFLALLREGFEGSFHRRGWLSWHLPPRIPFELLEPVRNTIDGIEKRTSLNVVWLKSLTCGLIMESSSMTWWGVPMEGMLNPGDGSI